MTRRPAHPCRTRLAHAVEWHSVSIARGTHGLHYSAHGFMGRALSKTEYTVFFKTEFFSRVLS